MRVKIASSTHAQWIDDVIEQWRMASWKLLIETMTRTIDEWQDTVDYCLGKWRRREVGGGSGNRDGPDGYINRVHSPVSSDFSYQANDSSMILSAGKYKESDCSVSTFLPFHIS